MAANKVLEDTENELSILAVGEGKPSWDRGETIRFLEGKGPTGVGPERDVPDSISKTKLRAYVLGCVTAYTWSGKVSTENMTNLTKLWKGLPSLCGIIPPPGDLLVDSTDDMALFTVACKKLYAVYMPFAREHLTALGHTLVDNLSAVRHHEGYRRHFDLQAKELRSKGVHLESDNRYPTQMCVCECIVIVLNISSKTHI